MRLRLVLAATAFFISFGMMQASTLSTLAVDAVASKSVASEPLTFDATTGKLTGFSISNTGGAGSAVFTGAQMTFAPMIGTTGNVFAASLPYISLDLPQPSSPLMGYTGGSPCTASSFCPGDANGVQLVEGASLDDATSGTLTFMPPVPVRPESSSLLMLGAGVLVLGSVMRRRRV